MKIEAVLVRASPIMEGVTGIMIAGLIYYSGKLILKDQLDINNFFSFLAAMMLSYQPVRSLATLNMGINQGIAAARRILPIIDLKNKIIEKENSKNLEIQNGEIKFENVNFRYNKDEKKVLNSVNLEIKGGETASSITDRDWAKNQWIHFEGLGYVGFVWGEVVSTSIETKLSKSILFNRE